MANEDLKQEVQRLSDEVTELQKDVAEANDLLKSHQHTGADKSSLTQGKPDLKAATLSLSGGVINSNSTGTAPFNIYDMGKLDDGSDDFTQTRRAFGMQIGTEGKKGSETEQVEGILSVGKNLTSIPNYNDFDTFNFSEVSILHKPNNKSTPPFSSLVGIRTPYIDSVDPTGTIAIGGNTLTDELLTLTPNSLTGCRLTLSNAAGMLEGWLIASNTDTTITIKGNWLSPSGQYIYEVYGPMYLGDPDNPWRSLYLDNESGRAIRFGQGPSTGVQVIGLYYGTGNPTGNLAANPGSLYLNMAGGTGTIYAKESANDATGWVALGSGTTTRVAALIAVPSDTYVAVKEGTYAIPISADLNGMSLTAALANVYVKGVTGSTTVMIRKSSGGADVDMLTGAITIGNVYYANNGTIDATHKAVATGDQVYVDVDTIHSGTAPKGLSVVLTFS